MIRISQTRQTNYSLDDAFLYTIGVEDFNKDNRFDIVVTNKGAKNIGILLGHGNDSFSEPTIFSTGSSSAISVGIGDLNNDNLPDKTIVNNNVNSISILSGCNEGFQTQTTYPTGSSPWSLAVGDFNNDGQPDIIVANYAANNIIVLLGYGNYTFKDPKEFLTTIGDFNKDKKSGFCGRKRRYW